MNGTTTIDDGTFNIYAGTNTAAGVRAHVYENNSYGYYVRGEAIVNGGTFNVNTWNGDAAYGVYVTGATGNFSATSATGYTGTKPAKYAVAGHATINGGTFIMNPSTGAASYAFVLQANIGSAPTIDYPKCEVNGGFFQMKGTGVYAANDKATEDAEGNPNLWVKGGHFSTKTNLEQASPKNYVRVPYYVLNCVHPDYKATYPYEVAEAYTITFKDDEDNTLWSGLQPKGSTAVYPLTNGVPEKTASATNSYEFASWNTPLAEVTEDATYTASFTAVAKKFMVTWKDDKGNEIDHMEYASGQTPTHADPVKEGYTFTGWTPDITAVVDADQTYTAKFTINQYTIRWEDEDGSLIREDKVNYGVKPTEPTKPTKEGYSFSAWNPGVVKATEDVTYTATYLLNIASVTTSAGKTTNYTAWSSALSAANGAASSTLTLLTDVGGLGSQTVSQTFTLDLNGHTLSGTANKLINVNKSGKTLTIRDSQGGGKIATKSATSQLIAVCVTVGTLNIESGLIRAENTYTSTHTSYYGCGVWVYSGQVCNMSGGTVEGITNIDLAYGIYNNGGTVNITGGTIKAEAQTKAYGVVVNGNTTVTNEHDVVINASTTRTTIADAFYVIGAKTLTINGGVFTANALTTAGCAIEATAAATITVNGGKFKSSAKTVSNTGSATIHLNAGFYDTDTELAGFASPKKVVTLTTEPEKAEGYNYKIVDDAHQITFKNEDGSVVLQQSNIEDGVQPVYAGEAQTKSSTPKYSYTFDGWKDASDDHVYAANELPSVSKDAVYTAHFAQRAVKYPITFANIDGMGTDYVQMVAYDEVPVYNGATPYMSGAVSNYAYTFIGWDPELTAVTGAATYTPRFDLVISHNVSFVINNGSATTPAQLTVAEGAAVERPADQLIGCQHIAGWYKDEGLNEEWDFANDKMGDHDITLYAKWETKTYTITWLDENADEIDQTTVDCGTVPSHADLYKPSTAACSYEWRGWNKTLVAATANATYKSRGFTQVPKRYAITFVTGAGATVINPIEQEVGSEIAPPADPTREGYTFNGWIPTVPMVMPANDVTCVAQWTVNTHSLSWNFDGGTPSGTYTEAGNTIAYGTTIIYPTLSKTGYTFAGWSSNATSMPDADLTITASWTVNTHKLAWNFDGGTPSGSYTAEGDAVEYGTAITYPTVTKDGYIFAGWSTNATSMPDADLTITASWNLAIASVTASDGTTYYTTVAAAIEAANGKINPSVKMLQNASVASEVEITATMTIDLNGKTISSTLASATGVFKINASGKTITIKDSGTGGKIYHKASTSGTNYLYGVNITAGSMSIESGTIYAENTGSSRAYGINTATSATLVTVSGSASIEAKSSSSFGIYTNNDCNLTMTGGTFTATGSGSRGVYTKGTTTLTNATITASGSDSRAIFAKEGTMAINSGTYTAEGTGSVYVIFFESGKVTVNGGKFKGSTCEIAKRNSAYNVILQGGVYVHETDLAAKSTTPHHVLPITSGADYDAGYRYKVAEAYTVTFVDGDGKTIQSGLVEKGQTPEYAGTTPTKSPEVQYDYIFTGWDSDIVPVTANATYTAMFNDHTIRSYSIRWENIDGSEIRTDTLDYGTQPSYKGTPTYSDGTGKLYVFRAWKCQSDEVEYSSEDVLYQLVEGPETYIAQYDVINNLDVASEQTISVDAAVEVTTVRVEGKLKVAENKTLTTDKLILEGTPNSSGEIIGNIEAKEQAVFHFKQEGGFKAKTWYAVAVPWQVDSETGISFNGNVKTLGRDFDLIYYDGLRRSQGAIKAWNYVEEDANKTMVPGRAYMIYLSADAPFIRFERMSGAALLTDTLQTKKYKSTIDNSYADWNGIANPATFHAYLNVGATENIGQVYVAETKQYKQFNMRDSMLVVGQPIFVQPAEATTVVANSTAYNPSSAPLRVKESETSLTRYEFILAPTEADETDRIIVRMDEEKEENAYVVGQDLVKMGVSNLVPQMWINRYDSKMCINTVAPVNNTADYPLGISVQKDGEYELFIDNQPEDNSMLYLTYDGNAIWNLNYGGYVAYLNKGTDTHYGLRIVKKTRPIVTGIEDATIQNGEAIRKVIVNDQVYIIRNGEMYSVTGQKTK